MSAGCGDLAGLLGKRLKGTADVKALGRRAGREAVREDARRRTPPTCSPSSASAPRPPSRHRRRPRRAAARRRAPARAHAAGADGDAGPRPPPPRRRRPLRPASAPVTTTLDDDGDGQTDWEDPGCSDAGDMTENSEVPVSAACAATSGIGMGDDPTELTVGINPDCGLFWEAEVQVAPGVASCDGQQRLRVRRLRPDRLRARRRRPARRRRHDAHAQGPGRLLQEGHDRPAPGRGRRGHARDRAADVRAQLQAAAASPSRSAPTARTTTATA